MDWGVVVPTWAGRQAGKEGGKEHTYTDLMLLHIIIIIHAIVHANNTHQFAIVFSRIHTLTPSDLAHMQCN